jgi:hypothetical protein
MLSIVVCPDPDCAAPAELIVFSEGRPGRLSNLGDNRARRWWGDLYELCPDELLDERYGARDYEKITVLLQKSRAQKR